MDIYSYALGKIDNIYKYLDKNYGEVPRFRGIRFMKVEMPCNSTVSVDEMEMFNKYVGQDVIYIHTRCGNCGDDSYGDEDSNYVSCGAKDWEEKYCDLFLDHITENFDDTYCTHYFKAVVNDDYNEIIEGLKSGKEIEWWEENGV